MKSNPIKKQLKESFTWNDISLWNEYCMDTNSADYMLYASEDLPELLDGMKPIDIFWEGVNADHVRGAEYITFAPGYFKGLSDREIEDIYLSDPDFLEWKSEQEQAEQERTEAQTLSKSKKL